MAEAQLVKADRDPEMVRTKMGLELMNDRNIDVKTELNDKEIFAFSAVEAFTERIYTPRHIDVPFMSKTEAFKLRHELLLKLGDPGLQKNPQAYETYFKAITPSLEQLDAVLDPLAVIMENPDGTPFIRKYNKPVVYAKFAERVKKQRVSKDRKSRWEIMNLVVIDRAVNGLRDLIGRLEGQKDEPQGLVDRIKSAF
jgi:hypothetical protein